MLAGLKATAALWLGTRLTPASASSVDVQAVGVKFEPAFVFVEPGGTVNFTGMAGHNVETIDQMVPEGTEKILSELGNDISLTFDEPGIYLYKCTPHWGTRMGGAIVVGKPENPYEILDGYTAAIESDRGALLPAKGLLKKLRKKMETDGFE